MSFSFLSFVLVLVYPSTSDYSSDQRIHACCSKVIPRTNVDNFYIYTIENGKIKVTEFMMIL